MTKAEGRAQVRELIRKFENGKEGYKSSKTRMETGIRRELLDPLFKALGWDIDNSGNLPHNLKEVTHEYSLAAEDDTRLIKPDYAFSLNGKPHFFVEAKDSSLDLSKNDNPAFQLQTYSWSAKLPLGIVTDFEEFVVYDSRIEPVLNGAAQRGRHFYCLYEQYPEKWEELYALFSREAVAGGSLDAFKTKELRGERSVDAVFLERMDVWRRLLAEDIYTQNPGTGRRALNQAVQTILDRIIFLRICEDREIEDYGRLSGMLGSPGVYSRLLALFREADARYNSGLFHFKPEKGREDADYLTPALTISDNVLDTILKGLYYPEPFAFAVMPADILGQVYERFLGKVIGIGAEGVTVEDKPEVKKAGGVFYTPEYIVDYIVKNTVGRLVERKKPVDVAKIKILDPACGSGAFLINAYQRLLDWHLSYYAAAAKKPETWEKERRLIKDIDGAWRLSLVERKRILINNIFGVDIDSQAVEVTRLSLLLKCLEGETKHTAQLGLFDAHERVLPDLDLNIKCGNSLIGRDFYQAIQGTLFDREEKLRINAFDWQTEFKPIMDSGGFDAVIGNPPYLRIQGLTENYNNQLDYYIRRYKSAVKRFDLYLLFVEQGFSLLNQTGFHGYICPNKFVNSDFGSGLREFLNQNKAIERFVSFGNNLVFSTASTYTGILLLSKTDNRIFRYYEFPNIGKASIQEHLEGLGNESFTEYGTDKFSAAPWILSNSGADAVLNKISKFPELRECFSNIFQGVVTGVDNLYFLRAVGLDEETEDGMIEVFSERENRAIRMERSILKPVLKGEDVTRYEVPRYKHYTIYPYQEKDGKTLILQESQLSEKYPLAYAYLSNYKDELRELRIKFKTNPTYWYSCHRGREISLFEQQRIITPEISLGCNMTISPAGLYHNTKVYSFIAKADREESQLYWLGVLNSKLLWFFLKSTGYVLRGGYYTFKTEYLKPFPIRTINFDDPADKKLHEEMTTLVEDRLGYHKEMQKQWLDSIEQRSIEQDIADNDRRIDALVYQLYGLSDEEIRVVEGAV